MKLFSPTAKEPQHVLVFGDPGSGKSTLVSKLAEAGWKLIWISCDNGHSILRKLSPEAQSRIELIRLPDTRNYPVAVDAVRELFKYEPVSLCDIHGKSGCSVCTAAAASFTRINLGAIPADTIVVFDNLSQLSDSYLSLICKGKPVDYKLQLDDWGSLRFHLFKFLGDIQVAPFNFIGIAHAVEEEMVDKSKKIMPAVGSSNFAPKVTGYFDHAIYCHSRNGKHVAGSMTTYQPNLVTKSRTDIAIELMPVPDLAPFFDGAPPKVDVATPLLEGAKALVVSGNAVTVVKERSIEVHQPAAEPVATGASEIASRTAAALAKLRGRK